MSQRFNLGDVAETEKEMDDDDEKDYLLRKRKKHRVLATDKTRRFTSLLSGQGGSA